MATEVRDRVKYEAGLVAPAGVVHWRRADNKRTLCFRFAYINPKGDAEVNCVHCQREIWKLAKG